MDPERLRWTFTWQVIWLGHVLGAALAWWLLPGSFSWGHPRYWTNRVLPLIVVAAAAAGLWGAWRRHHRAYLSAAVFVAAMATAAVIAGAILFPTSARRFLPPALVIAAMLWVSCVGACRQQRLWCWPIVAASAAGVLIGAMVPLAERAPEPDTRPVVNSFAWPEVVPVAGAMPSKIPVGRSASLAPLSGEAEVRIGRLTISVRPLLEFESVSPDRCWTIFAPQSYHSGGRPRIVGMRSDAEGWYHYQSSFTEHLLNVEPVADDAGMRVEAFSRLERQVFSHLNSFCELTVFGHRRITLSFSPCERDRIEPLPVDYPVGRPARFAYVDADDDFHVVEARSGEKGPFRTLAQGKLGEGPLWVTIYDQQRPVCRLRIDDWAREAGRQLSPTAGWGVPVNTLEFSRMGESAAAPVWIWMSLSSTSVGRGWDSVGHRAGVYRNRLSIEPVAEAE